MAFRKASSIEVPEILFRTTKTGSPEIDMAFSEMGGIVPSQVTFLTGKPGSGKTTLALVVSSKMYLSTKRPPAFISLEMSDFQLALSKKKFPGFDNMMVDDEFSLTKSLNALKAMKPSSVVIDSLQKAADLLVSQGESPNFNKAQKDIVNALYKFAKETFIPVFLIGHCTKSGSYVGPSHLEHEVDTHITVDYDRELDLRTFTPGKNRFGGIVDPQVFGITSSGVWIGSPYVTDLEVDKDGALQPAHANSKFSTIWRQFNERNHASSSYSAIEARTMSQATIDFLKDFDSHNIVSNSYIKSPSRVHLTYKYNGVAQCASHKGEIRIGDVMMSNRFTIGSIGYRKEQPFIKRHCKTREDLFLWVMIHEWCHLYRGMQHHKIEFFKGVEALYIKVRASLI